MLPFSIPPGMLAGGLAAATFRNCGCICAAAVHGQIELITLPGDRWEAGTRFGKRLLKGLDSGRPARSACDTPSRRSVASSGRSVAWKKHGC